MSARRKFWSTPKGDDQEQTANKIFPHIFICLALCALTSRIKTVLAGELDCPQDNQALQASKEFRIETGFSIVFIQCWALCLFGFLDFY